MDEEERDIIKYNEEILNDLDYNKEGKSDDRLELNSNEIVAGKNGEVEIEEKEQSLEIDEFEKLYAITAARNEQFI